MRNARHGSGADVFAAIDLGTNNCRLLVARPTGDSFRVVDSFSRIVRLGEGIRKNGDFVNTAFVEKALSEIDAITDVYVYGLRVSAGLAPGEKEVIAAVVPADRDSFDIAAVLQTCRAKLDRNSVPDYIQVLDEIPKTASEKPQERFLVEAFAANRGQVCPATRYR